ERLLRRVRAFNKAQSARDAVGRRHAELRRTHKGKKFQNVKGGEFVDASPLGDKRGMTGNDGLFKQRGCIFFVARFTNIAIRRNPVQHITRVDDHRDIGKRDCHLGYLAFFSVSTRAIQPTRKTKAATKKAGWRYIISSGTIKNKAASR